MRRVSSGRVRIGLLLLLFATPGSAARADPAADMWAWLAQNPRVESSIVWQDPVTVAEKKISSWTQSEKDSLAAAYSLLAASGTAGLPETSPVSYVLNGQNVDKTAWDSRTAFCYFVAFVAQSLNVEIESKVAWSVRAFSDRELAMLFHSRSLFFVSVGVDTRPLIRASASGTYAAPTGISQPYMDGPFSFTPGDPGRIHAFIRDTGLIGSTPTATTQLVVDWARKYLTHYYGGNDTANLDDHWHYPGFAPVERVLAGTTSTSYGFARWTAGCWGTAGLLSTTLRTVNIPVLTFQREGHALPYFTRDSTYLTHGDDPYNALTRTTPHMPSSWFLIGQAQFDSWFDLSLSSATRLANIGKGPYQAAVDHLPVFLLQAYLRDSAASKTHAAGEVAGLLSSKFSVAQLESSSLWTRMDAAIASYGGADTQTWGDVDTAGPNAWYLNDASMTGDSFTSVVGQDALNGTSRHSPRRTFASVLPFLTPGDTIFIDAGTWTESVVISCDSIAIVGVDSLSSIIDPGDSGAGSAIRGLRATSRANLVIRNLGIANAWRGFEGVDLDRSQVRSVRIAGIGEAGMHLEGGSDTNTIEQCAVTRSRVGISLAGSAGNTLLDNACTSNESSGITLSSSGGNILLRNRSAQNGGPGFAITSASQNNRLQQNTTDSNAGWSIWIDATITSAILGRNNLGASPAHPDSGFYCATLSPITATRNWWGSADSAVLYGRIAGPGRGAVAYQPWRLGPADTTPGADTTAPAAPALTGSDSPYPYLRITWNASATNEDGYSGATGVARYMVYRTRATQPDSWTRIGETTALAFTDTTAAAGIAYHYAVTACDNAPIFNESFFSSTHVGTPPRRMGDFTGDSGVTVLDVMQILPRFRLSLQYSELFDIGANGIDGLIDAEDILELGRRYGQ